MMKSPWRLVQIAPFLVAILLQEIIQVTSSGENLPDEFKVKNHPTQHKLCGRVHHRRTKRIIGGYESLEHGHPWTAHIVIEYNLDIKQCMGTLINKQWVLTTAQHFKTGFKSKGQTINLQEVQVNFGKHNLTRAEPGQKSMIIPFKNIYKHKGFNSETKENNIALIKLPEPVHFSETIQPICLPSSKMPLSDFEGELVTMAGWGILGNGKHSEVLQEAIAYVIAEETCREEIKSITKRDVCVDGTYANVCTGDLGAPLEYQDMEGLNILLGINSKVKAKFDRSCDAGSSALFLYIPKYIDWINKVTRLKFP